jgi:hypothetical protein
LGKGKNVMVYDFFREVKKSPAKKSPIKTKKEDESIPVEKKPKVEMVDDTSTSKYFKDVKMEPLDALEESDSLQKIQKMKRVKTEKVKKVIKKEPISDVCFVNTH